jgi:negative regulator of sigma E activity
MTMNPDQLSCLIDGELEADSLAAALQALASRADAREAVTLFQIVGDALRGRVVEDDGYSRRILAALDGVQIERQARGVDPESQQAL